MDKEIEELTRKIGAIVEEMKLPQNRARAPTLKRRAMQLMKRRHAIQARQGRL